VSDHSGSIALAITAIGSSGTFDADWESPIAEELRNRAATVSPPGPPPRREATPRSRHLDRSLWSPRCLLCGRFPSGLDDRPRLLVGHDLAVMGLPVRINTAPGSARKTALRTGFRYPRAGCDQHWPWDDRWRRLMPRTRNHRGECSSQRRRGSSPPPQPTCVRTAIDRG
jgi:hypothetical protein